MSHHVQYLAKKLQAVKRPARGIGPLSPQRGASASDPLSLACIRSIKDKPSDGKEFLRVFPGYIEVRNHQFKLPVRPLDHARAKRGAIRVFSRHARTRMKKKMASLVLFPEVWQDFTFADDVMSGLSPGERCRYAAATMKRFQYYCEKEGIDGFWKKEMEPRKSGPLLGELVTHYHCAYRSRVPLTAAEYDAVRTRLAVAWVRCSQTKMTGDALSVALNEKSWRFIETKNGAQIYFTKYISKASLPDNGESIGRCYGLIGSPVFAEAKILPIKDVHAVLLRRMLRRKAVYHKKDGRKGKLSKNMALRLRLPRSAFSFFIDEESIKRWWVEFCAPHADELSKKEIGGSKWSSRRVAIRL